MSHCFVFCDIIHLLLIILGGTMDKKEYMDRLHKYVEIIREKTDFVPDCALTLGSGLGDFAENLEVVCTVSYKDLPGFPVSTAPGHRGEFVFGKLNGVNVACMRGRIHYYEGLPMSEVVLPIRLLKMLGAKFAIITNAVGGINTDYSVGSFVCSKDYIAFNVPSPLAGPNLDELGQRFPDMTEPYDPELRKIVMDVAKENMIEVHEGVLMQLSGPQYESAAEIRACKALGADIVGMSSAVEVIAARHMGMRVAGISCVSNMACGISKNKLTEEEVFEVTSKVSKNFEKLVIGLISKLK